MAEKTRPRPAAASTPHNDREDEANIGFFFGNWDKRATSRVVQRNIDDQLKKNPCGIIGLAECQRATEQMLTEWGPPAVAGGGQPAVAGGEPTDEGFDTRAEKVFLTIRPPNEKDVSLLLAASDTVAESVECLHWQRSNDGIYKTKSGKNAIAHSRLMIGEITLHNNCLLYTSPSPRD